MGTKVLYSVDIAFLYPCRKTGAILLGLKPVYTAEDNGDIHVSILNR